MTDPKSTISTEMGSYHMSYIMKFNIEGYILISGAPLRVTRSILGLNVRFNVNIPSKYTISHTYLN